MNTNFRHDIKMTNDVYSRNQKLKNQAATNSIKNKQKNDKKTTIQKYQNMVKILENAGLI